MPRRCCRPPLASSRGVSLSAPVWALSSFFAGSSFFVPRQRSLASPPAWVRASPMQPALRGRQRRGLNARVSPHAGGVRKSSSRAVCSSAVFPYCARRVPLPPEVPASAARPGRADQNIQPREERRHGGADLDDRRLLPVPHPAPLQLPRQARSGRGRILLRSSDARIAQDVTLEAATQKNCSPFEPPRKYPVAAYR
jgi:hypothetical protein